MFASQRAMDWIRNHPVALIGTAAALLLGWVITVAGEHWISKHIRDPREHYRKRKLVRTFVTISVVTIIILLWARLLEHTGTFLGIIGAGLAIALREPLLSVAARIAIFAGHIFDVGDRIEVEKMSGDIIDIGFFYTRMMEIGNWISADQYSGRIVQFPNAKVFGNAVFNYTQNFEYLWDEVQLNITYESNLTAAIEILTSAGRKYTEDFLKGAQEQLEQMRRYFLVANFELEPQVFIKVTTNWVGLTMRYVVAPKKRRAASSFLYREVLSQIQHRSDITIGTDTMEVTVKSQEQLPGNEKAA